MIRAMNLLVPYSGKSVSIKIQNILRPKNPISNVCTCTWNKFKRLEVGGFFVSLCLCQLLRSPFIHYQWTAHWMCLNEIPSYQIWKAGMEAKCLYIISQAMEQPKTFIFHHQQWRRTLKPVTWKVWLDSLHTTQGKRLHFIKVLGEELQRIW